MQRANDRIEGGSAAKSSWGVVVPISFVLAIFLMLGCGPAFSTSEGKQDADGAGDTVTNDAVTDPLDARFDGSASDVDAEHASDASLDGVLDTSLDGVLDTSLDGVLDTDGAFPCEDGDRQCEGATYKWCDKGDWKTLVCDLSTHKCDKELGGCHRTTCSPACSAGEFCRDDNRCVSKVFETQWEVQEGNLTITLPYYEGADGARCDFHVLWGDESNTADFSKAQRVTACEPPGVQHEYKKAGSYNVKIRGTYIGWGQENAGQVSLEQLSKVITFGPVGLTQYAFYGIGSVTFAGTDVPDATKLTNAKSMFEKATGNNYAIADWDVSNTLDMSRMFFGTNDQFCTDVREWNPNTNVTLDGIFKESGMCNEILCELVKREGSVWQKNATKLGKSCRESGLSRKTVFIH